MRNFTRGEPVTVIDINSPFYNWAGTVEEALNDGAYYAVKCSYGGYGLGPTMWLTFSREQLAAGVPKEA